MRINFTVKLCLILLSLTLNEATAQKKVSIYDEFLIGVFWPPVWAHTNDMQYKRMRDANIDVIQNVSSTDLYTVEKNKKMLDLAHKFGMKVMVADPRVKGSAAEVGKMVDEFKNHPATFGYYIMDEPDTSQLKWCAETLQTIMKGDSEKMAHVNLFPVYALGAQLGNINYEVEYVERWIEMAGPANIEYLAFDHYPFAGDGHFRYSYYGNMDIIRRAGLKYNLKTSAYLQSMGIPGAFKRPSEGELRFNVYSMLAYGIKHPVWFTYWTPSGQGEKFLPSVVDADGNPTDLYPLVKQLGAEMKSLGKTLMQLDAKDVFHIGDSIPEGAPTLPENFLLRPVGKSFLITDFQDRKTGKKYVMVVNKNYEKSETTDFLLNEEIKKIAVLGEKGKRGKLRVKNNKVINQHFLAGEGKLYQIN